MRKFGALPTWLIMKLASFFVPDGHMLKKRITLEDWYWGQTELCRGFDITLWISCPQIVILTVLLINIS